MGRILTTAIVRASAIVTLAGAADYLTLTVIELRRGVLYYYTLSTKVTKL